MAVHSIGMEKGHNTLVSVSWCGRFCPAFFIVRSSNWNGFAMIKAVRLSLYQAQMALTFIWRQRKKSKTHHWKTVSQMSSHCCGRRLGVSRNKNRKNSFDDEAAETQLSLCFFYGLQKKAAVASLSLSQSDDFVTCIFHSNLNWLRQTDF